MAVFLIYLPGLYLYGTLGRFSLLFCFVLEPLINFSGFFMLNSLVIKNNYYICI